MSLNDIVLRNTLPEKIEKIDYSFKLIISIFIPFLKIVYYIIELISKFTIRYIKNFEKVYIQFLVGITHIKYGKILKEIHWFYCFVLYL